VSINWGAWAQVGMTSGYNQDQQQRWDKLGLGSLAPAQGLALLDRILTAPPVQFAVLPIVWPRYLSALTGPDAPPFFEQVVEQERGQTGQPEPEAKPRLLQQLYAAVPEDYRGILLAQLRELARSVLGLESMAVIPDHHALPELGLDSLMAVELRNQLAAHTGVTVAVADLLQGHSLSQIAATVLAQLSPAGARLLPPDAKPEPAVEPEWEVLEL
jgi:hypothetical protein